MPIRMNIPGLTSIKGEIILVSLKVKDEMYEISRNKSDLTLFSNRDNRDKVG